MAKSMREHVMETPPLQLHKWQKNLIFKAVQAAELHPRDFDFVNDDAGVRLKH
jgi:hypothetical protein